MTMESSLKEGGGIKIETTSLKEGGGIKIETTVLPFAMLALFA